MASRWEMLAEIMQGANVPDDYGLIAELVRICEAGHDLDSFYERAKTDGSLAISAPDFEDIVFDILSDAWVQVKFPDYQPRRVENPSGDPGKELKRPLAITEHLAALDE